MDINLLIRSLLAINFYIVFMASVLIRPCVSDLNVVA